MSIRLNGTTGYLEYGDKVISSYPFSIVYWANWNDNGAVQYVVTQASTGDRYFGGYHNAFGVQETMAIHTNAVDAGISKSYTLDTTMRLCILVFTSTVSRHIYYGSNVESSVDTTYVADQISSCNRTQVGGIVYNGGGLNFPCASSIAEVHFYARALGDSDYDTLAGGALPEDTADWIDGWGLEDQSDLVSIGGTRTLTLTGAFHGTAAATHPIDTTGRGGGSSTTPLIGGLTHGILTKGRLVA